MPGVGKQWQPASKHASLSTLILLPFQTKRKADLRFAALPKINTFRGGLFASTFWCFLLVRRRRLEPPIRVLFRYRQENALTTEVRYDKRCRTLNSSGCLQKGRRGLAGSLDCCVQPLRMDSRRMS